MPAMTPTPSTRSTTPARPLLSKTRRALIGDCRAGTGPEVRGMARTLIQWRQAILA
jgi:hypothetical protein